MALPRWPASLHDGEGHSASILLLGQYAAGNFGLQFDNASGTPGTLVSYQTIVEPFTVVANQP